MSVTKVVVGCQQLILRASGLGPCGFLWLHGDGWIPAGSALPGPSPGVFLCPHKPRAHFLLVPSGRKIPECALDGDGLERDKGQITKALCMHAVVHKEVQAPSEPS